MVCWVYKINISIKDSKECHLLALLLSLRLVYRFYLFVFIPLSVISSLLVFRFYLSVLLQLPLSLSLLQKPNYHCLVESICLFKIFLLQYIDNYKLLFYLPSFPLANSTHISDTGNPFCQP